MPESATEKGRLPRISLVLVILIEICSEVDDLSCLGKFDMRKKQAKWLACCKYTI